MNITFPDKLVMAILQPKDVQNPSSKEKLDFVPNLHFRGSTANVAVLCKENGIVEADPVNKLENLTVVIANFYTRKILFNI